MNAKNIENKLKKKYPHITLTDIKPVDPLNSFDRTLQTGRSGSNAKYLYILDLQAVICQILFGNIYNSWPRWCRINKSQNVSSIHLIIIDGMSDHTLSECLLKYADSMKLKKSVDMLNTKLDRSIKFVNPISYGMTWKVELLEVPTCLLGSEFRLSKKNGLDTVKVNDAKRVLKKRFRDMGTLEKHDLTLLRKKYKLDDISFSEENDIKQKEDAFSRTQLLMSLAQMEKEKIPRSVLGDTRWANFKYSVPSGYENVTDSSPIFALDCEMVECIDPQNNRITKDLASVSIINENRETVYHKYVRPPRLIVNYLTKYSGITPGIMEDTTTTLEAVQSDLSKIIPPNAILAGHSIGNDLEALKLFHPYLIDTSVIYNLEGLRGSKTKLKFLCSLFLDREIQNDKARGHDSLEDALATMDLILLKLSKTAKFGDITAEEEVVHEADVVDTKTDPDPVRPVSTDDAAHLRHLKLVQNCTQSGESMNLIDSLLPTLKNPNLHAVVAAVNDKDGLGKAWYPDEFRQFLADQQREEAQLRNKSTTNIVRRPHPFLLSEVSCSALPENELPSKKWITKLFKKVTQEFDELPPHALCGLMFTDGPCSATQENTGFGKFYFGITPPAKEAS